MKKENIDISVIMPALNEEENILTAINNALRAFEDFKISGEIIVVNDGSTDRTGRLVNDSFMQESRVRLMKHEVAKGIGASFWDGVDEAKGNIIVMIPGDNEVDPWEIFRYYPLLENVDIVIPFAFNKRVRSLHRRALSLVYRCIVNLTFVTNFNYTNGSVLYRKSILKELSYRSNGFFFQTDILIRTARKGYLYAEVPYRLGVRKEGISKAISFPSLLQVIKGYIRLVIDIYLSKRPSSSGSFTDDSITGTRR